MNKVRTALMHAKVSQSKKAIWRRALCFGLQEDLPPPCGYCKTWLNGNGVIVTDCKGAAIVANKLKALETSKCSG
eukprot:4515052-Amphidinium_carterae.2